MDVSQSTFPKLSKIEIGLENCDVITIDNEDIKYVSINSISKDIDIVQDGDIIEHSYCNSLNMLLKPSANKTYQEFQQNGKDYECKVFERLQTYNDITSIQLIYNNGTKTDDIYVLYKDKNENELGSPNVYMSTYISDFGDLFIVVDKDKTATQAYFE